MNLGAEHFLIFAFILFSFGLLMVISVRNLLKVLIGIELMLNAVALNFAAINVYSVHINHSGQIFSLFIMAVSAIELAVFVTLLVTAFKKLKTVDVKEYTTLREEA